MFGSQIPARKKWSDPIRDPGVIRVRAFALLLTPTGLIERQMLDYSCSCAAIAAAVRGQGGNETDLASGWNGEAMLPPMGPGC